MVEREAVAQGRVVPALDVTSELNYYYLVIELEIKYFIDYREFEIFHEQLVGGLLMHMNSRTYIQ